MAEDSFTLTTFYTSWKAYQDRLAAALAPLSAEQLALGAAPNLRSVGANAGHIIGCRVGWFSYTLGEDLSAELTGVRWDGPDARIRTAAELVRGLELSWQMMAERLARWSSADMEQTFPDEFDGVPVQLSRAWIVWHVLEHDLHHGGEISFTLGAHGLQAGFTS
jgi:uncharacterized damage-inducible protein DinB